MTPEKLELQKNIILQKEYLSTEDAEFYLKNIKGIQITDTTLRTAISRGFGPAYFKMNRRVLYTKALLNEWVDQNMSAPKTCSMDNRGL